MAFDTLANVKTALMISGTTDDAVLTRLMDAAESFIEQHTGRAFAGGSFTETHPAGRGVVFLRNFPVSTVTSVKVDANRQFAADTTRAADTYVVHTDRGVIESVTGPFLPPRPGRGSTDWPQAVQVVYSTPTGQVPAAVWEAFVELIGHWHRQVKTHADLQHVLLTEKPDGTGGVRVYPWGLAGGLRIPPGVLQLLKPFRVPAV